MQIRLAHFNHGMFSKGLENGVVLLPLVSAAAESLLPAESIRALTRTAGGQMHPASHPQCLTYGAMIMEAQYLPEIQAESLQRWLHILVGILREGKNPCAGKYYSIRKGYPRFRVGNPPRRSWACLDRGPCLTTHTSWADSSVWEQQGKGFLAGRSLCNLGGSLCCSPYSPLTIVLCTGTEITPCSMLDEGSTVLEETNSPTPGTIHLLTERSQHVSKLPTT